MLIDLNLGYEDLLVKSFEQQVLNQSIGAIDVGVVTPPSSINVYMEYLASLVHREYLTNLIEEKLQEKLIPTYCYVRKYFEGSTLNPHTDRESCEIGLSYCIQGVPWDIDIGGEFMVTKIGNGVIYKGCDTIHSRPTPAPSETIQVFNHWVLKDGDKKSYAFDEGKNKEFYLCQQ